MAMRILVFVILTLLGLDLRAQISLSSMKEYRSSDSTQQSAILISAPWCKWCSKMKSHTFKDRRLQSLPRKWVVYELDYESKGSIQFGEKLFESDSDGVHALARALVGIDKMEVPYFILLNEKNEVVFEHNGYLNAQELESVLRSKK
jgi:thioredoxin-related protein